LDASTYGTGVGAVLTVAPLAVPARVSMHLGDEVRPVDRIRGMPDLRPGGNVGAQMNVTHPID